MNKWLPLLIIACCLVFSTTTFAMTYKAVKDGAWHDATVWDKGSVPGESNYVEIDGYEVTISDATGDVTVRKITLKNNNGLSHSKLFVQGSNLTVTVKKDFIATLSKENSGIYIQIEQGSKINVLENATFTRNTDNNTYNGLQLYMLDNAEFNVTRNLTFDYGNSGIELKQEFYLLNDAILTVEGTTTFTLRDGANFTLDLNDSSKAIFGGDLNLVQLGGVFMTVLTNNNSSLLVQGDVSLSSSKQYGYTKMNSKDASKIIIEGDYYLTSNTADAYVELVAESTDTTYVLGNIQLDAQSEDDVKMNLGAGANFYHGADINRPTAFGNLVMDPTATFTFNGAAPQSIPSMDMPGSGNDAFQYTNIAFGNTSGSPVSLEGPITISDHLELNMGIIATDSVKTLTIADGATISAGNANAFIDGPIIKQGSTNNINFIFPTGDGSTYAPIEISALFNATDQYTAQYFACPPPVEDIISSTLNAPLNSISSVEHWTLKKATGSAGVNVILHWSDSALSGITDVDNTVIAYLDPANGWFSSGNNGGPTLVGDGGWVTNDAACPPPVEDIITFGSMVSGGMASLPMELLAFEGNPKSETVWLDWETVEEIGNNHFSVEKSIDGIDFHSIGIVPSKGNGNHRYTIVDYKPCPSINYYRLRQVDNDGMFSFSEIIAVNLGTKKSVILFPNPVNDYIQIQGANFDDTQSTLVEVFDNQGRLLHSSTQQSENGSMLLYPSQINVNIPGNYFIKFSDANGSRMKKFVKG